MVNTLTSVVLLTTVRLAATQLVVPSCLQNCLTQAKTSLCSSSALTDTTSCITQQCVDAPATQNLIANLGVTFTPKALISCQQSLIPGSDDNSVTLPLNQSCATSPYGFKSFMPNAARSINAGNGCQMILYSDEECLGEAGSVDIGTMNRDQCIFHGGRSARLVCSSNIDAARAYIEAACKDESPLSYSLSSQTTSAASTSSAKFPLPYASSSASAQPTHTITLSSTAAGPVSYTNAPVSDQPTHTITLSSTMPGAQTAPSISSTALTYSSTSGTIASSSTSVSSASSTTSTATALSTSSIAGSTFTETGPHTTYLATLHSSIIAGPTYTLSEPNTTSVVTLDSQTIYEIWPVQTTSVTSSMNGTMSPYQTYTSPAISTATGDSTPSTNATYGTPTTSPSIIPAYTGAARRTMEGDSTLASAMAAVFFVFFALGWQLL